MSTATIAAPAAREAGEDSLTARLAAWIDAEGVTGHYDAEGIASRVTGQIHRSHVTRWLEQGGSAYLRHACENVKDSADQTDAQAFAESARDGHGLDDIRAAA